MENESINDLVERWELIGLLKGLKKYSKKKNAAKLYDKMAKYLIKKETPIRNEFENAAFAIIHRVIKSDGIWNGLFIPKEIEDTYNNFFDSRTKVFEACKKTADYYSMYNYKKKPKNGGIPSIR